MDLNNLWQWDKRKLACRIRPETGNPGGDDLRERFAELVGVDLKDILNEMKSTKKKKEEKDKVATDFEADKKFKEVLNRSHILGASQFALTEMKKIDDMKAASVTQKNVKKVFATLPKSPPKRVLLEIQRERSKPLRLPDADENNIAAARLEKKLAKKRLARMKAIAQQTAKAGDNTIDNKDSNEVFDMLKSIFKPYEGDKFTSRGDYISGMLYLSRSEDYENKHANKKATAKNGGRVRLTLTSLTTKDQGLLGSTREGADTTKLLTDLDSQGFSETSSLAESVSAKLYCATALCNWARNPQNANRLASEGAVRAIMQLFLEPAPKITKFCAGAFRYMSEHTALANSMIDDGALATMADVINNITDEFVLGNIAITLLNMTRVNGREEKIVETGIVLSFMNLIVAFPDMSLVCARGLYNLTCTDQSYLYIERVIRTLISLSSTGSASVKHMCAAALCNLSDLKSVRLRLIEEGVINILGVLSRGTETRTRRVCAMVLQNISNTKSCRAELVSRGCVGVTAGLSSDQDPIILRSVALTLANLAIEPGNCERIVVDSGVTALCNIALKYPTISGISQPVSQAFQLLCSCTSVRVQIVQEGCVTAVASLLRLSNDTTSIERCLIALCCLLSEHANHLSIVQQGLIVTIISLSSSPSDSIKDLCALTFLKLSLAEESRKHIVNSGAVSTIIGLSMHKSRSMQSRAAAALCFVSTYEYGMGRMVEEGIIPSLVNLILCDEIKTARFACAALCKLCVNAENAYLIAHSGAVPGLVNRVVSGDAITKQYSGAVLSTLSYYESCREKLSELNITSAIISLAELNDDIVRQRCLVAFANLSCEMSIHEEMVKRGVVQIISQLANSYQEVNYLCSAKALCNLACSQKSRMQIAKEGGVITLMMIAMVNSVDMQTKLLCVLALNNLMDDTTIDYMLNEGIIFSTASLSKLPDNKITQLCAKIFNRLSSYVEARPKMIEKASTVQALFALSDSTDSETFMLSVRTTNNLVLCPHTGSKAVELGALRVLEKGALSADKHVSFQSIQAIFSTTSRYSFLTMMAKSPMPSILLNAAQDSSGEKYDFCLKTLSMIAWHSDSLMFIQTRPFVESFFALIRTNFQVKSTLWITLIFRHLVIGYDDIQDFIDLNLMSALWKIYQMASESSIVMDDRLTILLTLVETIRAFCHIPKCVSALANSETQTVLLSAAELLTDKDKKMWNSSMYSIAFCIFSFASTSQETKTNTTTNTLIEILDRVATCQNEFSLELLAAAVSLYLSDIRGGSILLTPAVGSIITKILDVEPEDDISYNCISAIFALSRHNSCRGWLCQAPVSADSYVYRLSSSENTKLKANCARVLKNLQSDTNDAIEEGAVASLIAMSLEGKSKNTKVSEDTIFPEITVPATANLPVPKCSKEVVKEADAVWYSEHFVSKGGAAGKGPDAPEPPMSSLDSAENLMPHEEVEKSDETELKTRMSFAKMGCPPELKDMYLLSDTDFEQRNEDGSEVGEDLNEVSFEKFPSMALDDVTFPPFDNSIDASLTAESFEKGVAESKTNQSDAQSKNVESKSKKSSAKEENETPAKHKKRSKAKKVAPPKNDINIGDKAAKLGLYN